MTMTTATTPRTEVAGVSVPTGLFIDGVWRPSQSNGDFAVIDPARETVLARVADASVQDSLDALESAHRAQAAWGATTARQRAELLRRAFEMIQGRRAEFAAVITAEMGKPLAEAAGEVDYGSEFFRWFADQASQTHGDAAPAPGGGFDIVTAKVPVGPSLLITPWNFPLAMGTRKIGAALAAGCTVLIKPAAQTPLTAALLVEVLQQAGLPAGVVNFIPTLDAAAQSQALMADRRLRKVSFTGSTPVGSTLLHQAADNVLRSSMELGGNGPFLVLGDADVESAVDGAMLAKFRNGGQSCVAANRIIVHRDIAERFIDALSDRVEGLTPGPGDAADTTIGPLIDERQQRKVQELVDDAVQRGAVARVGGHSLPGTGFFYRPTVLVDIPADARLNREEVFGPVAAITVVDTDAEAIELANDTEFGLAAFVYARDLNRALDAAGQIEAGMVGINRGLVSEPAAPFGGVKASGLGREGGHLGIEEYLETKYYAIARS